MVLRSALVAVLVGLGLVVAAGIRPVNAAEGTDPPAVVVSIKPIHGLVAGVMAGVAVPELLVEGAGSPHSYALRPSQARALGRADLVFWMGEGLEHFLVKPLDALAADAMVVALSASPGVHTLATRSGGLRADDGTEDDPPDPGGEAGHVDMHLWLDPRNAAAMVATIAAALSGIDPERAAVYQANAAQLAADLARLDAELEARLAAGARSTLRGPP